MSTAYAKIVYDRNQDSLSGTETKVQFRYRYWSRNFIQFLEPNKKRKKRKKNPHFLGNTIFEKPEIEQIYKNNLKVFNSWQQIWI